ncbi:MAG: RNA polymerase sigma factor [Candidatus Pacebacteria bacterium]|jgi:RNA polymerase sigma-70 factor (ECF subfamily)|nr:RNA polymerase sigma factor [Candidatus Paceibacterota bacterium]
MAGLGNTTTGGSQEDRFLQAFHEYGDALFRHAMLRISDRERAIDLVHDTFTKVWSYVKNGHAVEQYRPFLYKVLNNLIIDEYRKQREQSLDALLAEEGVSEGSFPELIENTTEALAATLDGKQAFELVTTLPDVYREVLLLRFVDGLGPKEISELVEESENVVSVRIHRGLKILRDIMEEKDGGMVAKKKRG